MSSARRILGLMIMLALSVSAVLAQTPRSEDDPRNLAPTVSGGTGLFTVYDAQTLRKGEFNFGFFANHYHRDPGDVRFQEYPANFQVGFNDHLEFFANFEAQQVVVSRRPALLSGYYLPDVRTSTLAPGRVTIRPGTNVIGVVLGDPCGNGGFAGPCGTFGAFTARPSGNNVAVYPGLGAPVGGILPAIPNNVVPSYLPDAPFLSRFSGSGVGDITLGGKIRLTGPNNPFGFAIIPTVKIPTTTSLNTGLERGRSTGAWDYGVTLAFDGRLHKHVNLSSNIGFIKVGDPKAENMRLGALSGQAGVINGFGSSTAALDLPNKLVAGIAVDFPLSRYLALVAEITGTRYVGGHTPSLIVNNPTSVLAGARIFPARWVSLTAAYQRHLNWQSSLAAANSTPDGFIAGLSFGHVNKREPAILPNNPPTVAVNVGGVKNNTENLIHPDASTACPGDSISLSADAKDPDGDTLSYKWTTTGGRIIGEGANVVLDTTGLNAGDYSVTLEVDDGCGCVAFDTKTVKVSNCAVKPPPMVCPSAPNVTLSANSVNGGEAVTASASLSGGRDYGTPTYNWTVSGGTIASGQGTDSIRIDTTGLDGQSVTATVEVKGIDASCSNTASASFNIARKPEPPKFVGLTPCTTFKKNEARVNNACKAVLQDVARQLQSDPQAQLVVDSFRADNEKPADLDLQRGKNVRDRLADGGLGAAIDANRIVVRPGGVSTDGSQVKMTLVPAGAMMPEGGSPATLGDVTPEKKAAPAKKRRR